MSTRTLWILVVLAAVLVGLATWSGSRRTPERGEALVAGPLLPDLDARINDIGEVGIVGAGEAPLATLVRADAAGVEGAWGVAERDGWPADTDRLRALLLALSQARRLEAKTADPALHARLGVEALSQPDAAGVGVSLGTGADATLLVIGAPRGIDGTYVRLADQSQAWLIDRSLDVPRTPQAWLDRELLQVDAERVASARIAPPEGDSVEIIARDDGPGFTLAAIPKGRSPADAGELEGAAGLLSSLRIDDVARAPAGTAAFGDAPVGTARYALRDGLVFEMRFASDGTATQASFQVSLDEERAAAWVEAEQAKAAMEHERRQRAAAAVDADEAADASDAAAAVAEVQTAVDTPLAVTDPAADHAARVASLHEQLAGLQARLHGWVFTLPPYKAEHLRRGLEGYLAPPG